MLSIKSIASKHRAYLIKIIVLLSKIIPSCSYRVKKKLLYIAIAAPFSRQPSFYFKCTKLNIRLSYDI